MQVIQFYSHLNVSLHIKENVDQVTLSDSGDVMEKKHFIYCHMVSRCFTLLLICTHHTFSVKISFFIQGRLILANPNLINWTSHFGTSLLLISTWL